LFLHDFSIDPKTNSNQQQAQQRSESDTKGGARAQRNTLENKYRNLVKMEAKSITNCPGVTMSALCCWCSVCGARILCCLNNVFSFDDLVFLAFESRRSEEKIPNICQNMSQIHQK
jgi:hypothetical protein